MFKPIISMVLMLALGCAGTTPSVAQAPQPHFVVLDGDTVLVDGSPVRVAGIDAPELGPWARCWAEAALAGHARAMLQSLLDDDSHGWQLREASTADAQGKRTGRLVNRAGYDIADEMVVGGYAALTNGRWDWCGENANLHQVLDDESPPHGPSLWWPTAHMFDARAAD